MICEMSVNFNVSKHAYQALQQMTSQNKTVTIQLNGEGIITLSAIMLDFVELSDDWIGIE